MNDLETLRPEVREAINRQDRQKKCDEYCPVCEDRATIRAELLRLARYNDALRSKCNVIMSGSTQHLGRAERAEAELAALKARIAGSCRADGQRVFDLLGLPIEYGGTLALVPVEK